MPGPFQSFVGGMEQAQDLQTRTLALREEQAMFPVRLRQAQLGQKETELQISQIEAMLKVQAQMQQRFSQQDAQARGRGPGDSEMDMAARQALMLGLAYAPSQPQYGSELINAASRLSSNQAAMRDRELNDQIKYLNIFSGMINDIKFDPKNPQAAAAQLQQRAQTYQQQFAMNDPAMNVYGGTIERLARGGPDGKPLKFNLQQFNAMKAGAMNAKDTAMSGLLDLKQTTEEFRALTEQANAAYKKAAADAAAAREQNQPKVAGMPVTPGKPEMDMMAGFLRKFANVDPKETMDEGAVGSAEESLYSQYLRTAGGYTREQRIKLGNEAIGREAFDTWIAADPKNAQLLQRMKKAYQPPVTGMGAPAETPLDIRQRAAPPPAAPAAPPPGQEAQGPGEGFTVDQPQ